MTATTPIDSSVDRVQVEQIKTLYESITSLVLINLLVSCALVYALWEVVGQTTLLTWLGMVITMLAARLAIYWSFRRDFDEQYLARYKLFLILGSASAGLVWGIGGALLFLPEQLQYQLLILLSLLAMSAGSAFSLSIYLPAYFAFVPIMLAPVTVRLLMLGDSVHLALAMVTLVFFVAQTAFNRKINKSLTSAMALRFENLALVEELGIKNEEAERANRAKSSFLAAASHDLRQPLYALTLFTAALEEKETSSGTREITQQISRSVNALQSLFDALLDISKMDAGYGDLKKTRVSLQAVFDNLAHEFDPIAKERSLRINWPDINYWVKSEPNLLEQILRNYLSNAIRYTTKGEIKVSCGLTASQITIAVSDTGAGISIANQSAIFDEFYQVENPERDRKKGLGLGLSIVDRAANLLGHAISVNSQPGKGSTFSVMIERVDETDLVTAEPVRPEDTSVLQAHPLVIVIDDEESIRSGLEHLLMLWNCDVISSADDTGAIKQLSAYQRMPDAIISDLRLRDNRTGVEAVEAINAACKAKIPALLVTGDTEKETLNQLNKRGYQVLHKPVAPARLRAFLRSIATQKNLQDSTSP